MFRSSLVSWVREHWKVEEPDAARQAAHRVFQDGMVELYGHRVLPPELLQYFPMHWDHPHAVKGGPNENLDPAVVAEDYIRAVLVSEDHPVVTRFWLFGQAVRRMLTTFLLMDVSKVFVLQGMQPKQRQQRRLKIVLNFFKDGTELQNLKCSALSLRMTDKMLAVTARAPGKSPPPLVDLSTMKVIDEAVVELIAMLSKLATDATLNLVMAVSALLTTLLHLVARCLQYQRYPYTLWRLTQTHNPASYLDDCAAFLAAEPSTLDQGFLPSHLPPKQPPRRTTIFLFFVHSAWGLGCFAVLQCSRLYGFWGVGKGEVWGHRNGWFLWESWREEGGGCGFCNVICPPMRLLKGSPSRGNRGGATRCTDAPLSISTGTGGIVPNCAELCGCPPSRLWMQRGLQQLQTSSAPFWVKGCVSP